MQNSHKITIFMEKLPKKKKDKRFLSKSHVVMKFAKNSSCGGKHYQFFQPHSFSSLQKQSQKLMNYNGLTMSLVKVLIGL